MAILRKVVINVHPVFNNRAAIAAATLTHRHSRSSISPPPPPFSCSLSCFSSFTHTHTTHTQSQSLELIYLSKQETKRRFFNRLLYRSKQRGFLELDLVLGKWVEDNIHYLDETLIRALIHVLDLVFAALRERTMENLDSHSAPEVRAKPGQPWVRGWDNIKKG